MDIVIARLIATIVLGKLQRFRNMEVVPLFNSRPHGPEYLTLKEALALNHLTVTEATHTDSVSKVKVKNWFETPVLLLDSEELIGSRQDRVLSTTILLQEQSETMIPVTCIELNGWNYPSVAPAEEIESYLQAFQPVSGQKGLLVAINGEITGLDIVSREEAYPILHRQWVKSYAVDALFEAPQARRERFYDQALNFFHEAAKCGERAYPSFGGGLNFEFDGPTVSGSALVVGRDVIHLSLIRTLGPPQTNDGSLTGRGYEDASFCQNRTRFSSIQRR